MTMSTMPKICKLDGSTTSASCARAEATLACSAFCASFWRVRGAAAFGMVSSAKDDGIEIPGGQVPARPDSPVETHGDHRIAMTAMVLASKVGGTIVDPGISAVTDPGFIERLTGLGR